MKFTLTGEEAIKIVSDSLQNKLQSGCKFEPANYVYIADLTMVEMTQEEKDRRAAHEAELNAFQLKMAAEERAKEAAESAVSIASKEGPF